MPLSSVREVQIRVTVYLHLIVLYYSVKSTQSKECTLVESSWPTQTLQLIEQLGATLVLLVCCVVEQNTLGQ